MLINAAGTTAILVGGAALILAAEILPDGALIAGAATVIAAAALLATRNLRGRAWYRAYTAGEASGYARAQREQAVTPARGGGRGVD